MRDCSEHGVSSLIVAICRCNHQVSLYVVILFSCLGSTTTNSIDYKDSDCTRNLTAWYMRERERENNKTIKTNSNLDTTRD